MNYSFLFHTHSNFLYLSHKICLYESSTKIIYYSYIFRKCNKTCWYYGIICRMSFFFSVTNIVMDNVQYKKFHFHEVIWYNKTFQIKWSICLYRDATNSNIEKNLICMVYILWKKRKQRIIIILFTLYNKLWIIAY